MKLTTSECRLLMFSKCLKQFKDLQEHTKFLRATGRRAMLEIDKVDTEEINSFLSDEDCTKIRSMMKKEWTFTGKVIRSKVKVLCDYCQRQRINNQYVCSNRSTHTDLYLGCVCVGKIIHGEDKMKDKDFTRQFKEKLRDIPEVTTVSKKSAIPSTRKEQAEVIKICVAYLNKHGYGQGVINKLQETWNDGTELPLSYANMKELMDLCKRVKEYNKIPTGDTQFNSKEAEIDYKRTLNRLNKFPDSQFYQACKLRIEQYGELTPRMQEVLRGKNKSKKERV